MILFIDCYDSFSYNLTHLIASACPAEVVVVHNDQVSAEELERYLPFIDAIVLGPGPGNPHNSDDSGVLKDIWSLLARNPVPTFGVCFGYQSLALGFGGAVERMDPPQHGRVARVEHDGRSRLLKDVPSPFEVVRYHSLHATAASPLVCTAKDLTTTPSQPIEMAAEHATLPFYGVQFHPESVLSKHGLQILKNFWQAALEYNSAERSVAAGAIPQSIVVAHKPLLSGVEGTQTGDLAISELHFMSWKDVSAQFPDKVVLKSAASPAQWTIVGLLEPGSTPHLRAKSGTVLEGPLEREPTKVLPNTNFWEHAAKFMEPKLISRQRAAEVIGSTELPFLGGLVGYISYEGCSEHTIWKGQLPRDSGLSSDYSLVYITKSIVINENTNKTYLVGPESWTQSTATRLSEWQRGSSTRPPPAAPSRFKLRSMETTDRSTYEKAISQCFDSLKAGDSYELCLTTQTALDVEPSTGSDWGLFLQLVERNPAPYASYMNFDDTLIAASPERFMAWDHDKCEFRPIKGTVRKTPEMTRAKAEAILRTPKEQAENLMIVDLIRHDLGHLLGEVTTPQLMVVEEYHGVYQLVTSVEGKFQGTECSRRVTGIDVLYQSLPPGSMTGAPKQRSVEILNDLESHARGIYSGVHGYWSIDDRGDWSVVIRSLFRPKGGPKGRWLLGAGGAVTVLSTVDGEFDEMHTKMNTVLNTLS